ncbi:MAG: ATP-binding protein, partial [Leptospirales bacterium]|nr:ATP-binding protein [Leptospirales bacterium]
WRANKKNECLLVKGARQIGKTFIIDKFGREFYKKYIYINFIENPGLKTIFDESLEAGEIYKKISLNFLNLEFVPGDTLIFLDEIQECPNARTALKFLALDNKYDVIASGSLLGINYREIPSVPVGYETQMEMHSLDFEEFLWAIGLNEQAIGYVKEYFDRLEKIPDSMHTQMMKCLREYSVIGGMPAVINRYLETNNFNEVQKEQDKILTGFLDDISKYASMAEKPRARNCFLSVPKQLAKEYKKFQFSVVEKGATARKYANSLEWLRDANLIRFCFNVSTPSFPLTAYERDDQYKIYLNDIGLLVAMYGFEIKKEIIENTLKGPAKGGVYENLIADILIKKDRKLNYYKSDNNSQEIEFLLSSNGSVIPIEVKSGNGPSVSLNNLLAKPEIKTGYKLVAGNLGQADKKITMPLYMAMFL